MSAPTVTLAEFQAACKAQGVPREHIASRCPICQTVQSMADFTAAGVPAEKIEGNYGFNCIGRFTNAGPKLKDAPPGRGCDWSLGGLFRLHKLEVVTEDGKHHPTFEPATPEEAVSHMRRNEVLA